MRLVKKDSPLEIYFDSFKNLGLSFDKYNSNSGRILTDLMVSHFAKPFPRRSEKDGTREEWPAVDYVYFEFYLVIVIK